MNDNDIIKALECCCGMGAPDCAWCLRLHDNDLSTIECMNILARDALDLINRQKAEISDLKAKNEICAEVIARQDKDINNLVKRNDGGRK